MGKKAVLIGCNYPGMEDELHGCVNDVCNVQCSLIDRFGFSINDIEVLVDTNPIFMQPTGKNICHVLQSLVESASPGDFLFVYFSGHGSQLPLESDDLLDDTGYDECIVPTDFNYIHDDFFKQLASAVPDGCRLTIVSDSCHSGGLIDGVKEQIGESTFANRAEETVEDDTEEAIEEGYEEQGKNGKCKSLSISTLIEVLKQKTGKKDISLGNVRPTLYEMFGEDSSPMVKKFMKQMVSKLKQNEGKGNEGEPELGSEEEGYDGDTIRYNPRNGVLLSGCQFNEFSQEINREEEGEPCGAFTRAILTVLAESSGRVSNYELLTKVREMLESQGYAQKPGLYCSDENVEAAFIC